MDLIAYAKSKQYTDESLIGGGAVKGKNCTISKIEEVDGGNKVTFSWTLDDGTVKTQTLNVKDGSSIASVEIDADNHIIVTLTDGSKLDGGEMPKPDVEVSKEDGNALTKKTDGLYVGATGVEISKEDGNIIQNKTDGLYAPKIDINTITGETEPTVPSLEFMKANTYSLGIPELDLTEGQDLNDLTTRNRKYKTTGAVAATLLNCPVTTTGFRLTVYSMSVTSYVTQIIETADERYVRYWNKSKNKWYDWKKIATDDDLANYVAIQQKAEDKGKALVVGEDGKLLLGAVVTDLTEVNEKFEENADWLKGKNLYADTNELTYNGNDNVYVGGADFYLPIGEYIFSAENNYSKAVIFWFRESSPVDDNTNHEVAVGDKTSFVFNVTDSGLPISIGGRASDRSVLSVPNVLKNIMVRKSSETDDAYEPYRGKSNLELAEEISRKELELDELKMLGWTVPKGCPIQNTVSGNQFIQRVGRVSLTDKTWTADGIGVGGVNVFRFEIPTNCKTYSNSTKWNIYVDGYKTLPLVLGYVNDVASTDKAVGGRNAGGNFIEFSTKSYSTVTDFKAYMDASGLYLYYELATPITRQIDGNENPNMVSSKLERFVAPSTDAELLALPNGIYSINVADVGTSLFPNSWGTLVVLKSGFVYGTMLYIGANAKLYFRNINNGAWREASWTALN